MMIEQPSATPVETLKRAVSLAFPERSDVARLEFDGSVAQAWQAFARLLALDETQLARAMAPIFDVEPAGPLDAEPEALALIPSNYCQSNKILPLRLADGALVVATADPTNTEIGERVTFLADMPVRWVLAAPQEIDDAIVLSFSKAAARESDAGTAAANSAIDEHAIVKLGRALLNSAIDQRASDLHIQPFLGSAVVRIRVDGNLRRLTMLPDAVAMTLIRHFKARSGMESTNCQVPQDGRMSLVADDREFDMRVSTLPATRGERLVIRFLDQSRVHRLSGANFSLAALQTLRRAISRPSGLVIMTGPTGSGKTSTLYSMLAEINRSTVNIITVENPVEYRITGISQVEVNEKAGRTFLAALRSILRQDPDVILIGEIRDAETAEIAAQAALTGHLVLSTLHTNDALTAIPRLLNLGVPPSILADSLSAVAAQRLCRMLCPACKVPVTEPLTPEEKTFLEVTRNTPGHRPVGCKQCDYTGYRGRLPIVDIVEMTKGLRDAVALGESRLAELEKLREGGLKSLAASGSLRVISGDTTVREVMDAVGPSFWPELAEHYGSFSYTGALDISPSQITAGQGVLVMSADADLAKQLEPVLQDEGLRIVVATSAEQARELLTRDEDIAFIVGDVPDNASLDEATDLLRRNRLHISWARLPSIVLLPAHLKKYETTLRESGVMGMFMSKPVAPSAILAHIRRAQAR
jgi:type IV pilus assembly protein PilB